MRFLRAKGGQRGIGLIEVLVAVTMLAIIGTVIVRAYGTNYRANRVLDEQVVAVNLATAYIEAIKQSDYTDNYTAATADITIPSQFSVNMNVLASSDAVNYVPATGSENETFQNIVISVYSGGKQVFTMCTYRAKR